MKYMHIYTQYHTPRFWLPKIDRKIQALKILNYLSL